LTRTRGFGPKPKANAGNFDLLAGYIWAY
jgi:hypothetical protein